MIRTQLFIRRLVSVPWLLAALVVGWTGAEEAMAQGEPQDIFLEIDVFEVSEAVGKDGGKVDITVTASVKNAAVEEPVRIGLDFRSEYSIIGEPTDELYDDSDGIHKDGLGVKFRFEGLQDPIVIKAGEKSAVSTISLFPRDDGPEVLFDHDGDGGSSTDEIPPTYIYIAIVDAYVQGMPGVQRVSETDVGGFDVIHNDESPVVLRLFDDDLTASRLVFAPSIHEISNESDELTITVRGYLDGKNPFATNKELSFRDIYSLETLSDMAFDWALSGQLSEYFSTYGTQDSIAVRDVDYTEISGFGSVTLAKDKTDFEVKVTLDPNSFNNEDHYPRYILLGVEKDTLAYDSDPTTDAFDAAGVRLQPAVIRINYANTPKVKSLEEVSTPIYEDGGPQLLEVKVTLENAVEEATGIDVRLHEVDGKGERDRDYEVELRERLVIESGDSGIANILVTPRPASAEDDWKIRITASIGDEAARADTVNIVDAQTAISEIRLMASPASIKETDGSTDVMITAHVVGKVPDADINIPLTALASGEATREVDYRADFNTLTIPAGQLTATETITIHPTADNADDGDGAKKNETILVSSTATKDDNRVVPGTEIKVIQATITLVDTPTPAPEPDAPPSLTFESDDVSIMGTVGEALEAMLPAAMGTDNITYLVRGLPSGLSFDEDSRMVSGTPMAAGETAIEYFAVGDGNLSAKLTGMVTIEKEPIPQVLVKSIAADIDLLRENAGHATTIRLTVTLAQAAAADEAVMLSFAAPSAGNTAVRDAHFEARWVVGPVITIPQGSASGTAELTVTPINNSRVGENAFGVRATTDSDSDGAKTDIVIADDESQSSAIVLSVDPASISETGGSVAVTVTATLAGGGLDADTMVMVGISSASSAVRDADYTASFARGATQITILAGASSGSTTVTITPIADGEEEPGDYIVLTGSAAGLATGSAVIALEDGGMMDDDGEMMDDDGEMMDDEEEMMMLAFDAEVADQAYTAGTAITPLTLPEATGGEDIRYRVFGLPAGLSFDAATRTISGTPEAATGGAVEVTFLAEDGTGAAALTFHITVNPALSLGFGAGKLVPTDGLTDIRAFVVGQRVEGLTLPEGFGGTAPLTYSLSPALPAGLTFDAITRTIAGTPTVASETVYTYTITDANGASLSLMLQTRPAAFSLANNYPNPFNPATTIQYALPQAADVELTVYNVVGQPVRTLVAEHQSAGRYVVEWDATNDSGHSLSSGMYFYRLQAGGEFHEVKKMLLLK